MSAGTLAIRRAISGVDRQILEGEPKTAKSRRTVAFDPEVVGVLKRHRTAWKAERRSRGAKWRETDVVFASEDGEWLRPNKVSPEFVSSIGRSGLPSPSLHCLRHAWERIALVERKLPITVVGARLGHASASITLDINSHAMSLENEEAALDVASVIVSKGFQRGPCWQMLAAGRACYRHDRRLMRCIRGLSRVLASMQGAGLKEDLVPPTEFEFWQATLAGSGAGPPEYA